MLGKLSCFVLHVQLENMWLEILVVFLLRYVKCIGQFLDGSAVNRAIQIDRKFGAKYSSVFTANFNVMTV